MDYMYRSPDDFAALGTNIIDQEALATAIQGAGLSSTLETVTTWSGGVDCCLTFDSALSGADETTVAGILAAHTGNAIGLDGVWVV